MSSEEHLSPRVAEGRLNNRRAATKSTKRDEERLSLENYRHIYNPLKLVSPLSNSSTYKDTFILEDNYTHMDDDG